MVELIVDFVKQPCSCVLGSPSLVGHARCILGQALLKVCRLLSTALRNRNVILNSVKF